MAELRNPGERSVSSSPSPAPGREGPPRLAGAANGQRPQAPSEPPGSSSLAAPLSGDAPASSSRVRDPGADATSDLAGALHEVSNALTVVLGWIERARGAAGDPEALERALAVAGARAAEARTIVRRAIGAEGPPEADGAVEAVVAEALTGLEPELRRAALATRVELDPAVAGRSVAGAPSVLQILTNLLLNAAAMAPRGSLVRVEARPAAAGDGVLFAVVDAGPGIAPERRATLFEAGVSTRPGGAGIGLRHAASLARARGGELSLADSAAGARFELLWPLRPPVAPAPPPPRPSGTRAVSLAGTRILLVEDDDAVVDLLDTALSARGAELVSVRRRSELAAALATGPFDAALFDISPIADDVHGAVASVRAAGAAARMVMISGTAAALPALPDGWIAAWVRKPFEVGEILAALR